MQEPVRSAAVLHALGPATEQLLQPGCTAAQLWANQACQAPTGTVTATWTTLENVQQAIVKISVLSHGSIVSYYFACRKGNKIVRC